MNAYPQGLPDLLRKRATIRLAVLAAEDTLEATRVQVQQAAYEQLARDGQVGRNEDQRKLQMASALAASPPYQQALRNLRDQQGTLWRFEAEIDALHEIRRDRDAGLRQRLIELAESGRLPVAL